MKRLILIIFILASVGIAQAQVPPPFILPPGLQGYVSGGVFLSSLPVSLPASSAGQAPLTIPHGTAPNSPANGNTWTTTAGFYVRINGATIGPMIDGAIVPVTISGTGAVAATNLRGQTLRVTGAYTMSLPAVTSGLNADAYPTGAYAICITPNGTDALIVDGVSQTAGYKACTTGSAQDRIQFQYDSAGLWKVVANCLLTVSAP